MSPALETVFYNTDTTTSIRAREDFGQSDAIAGFKPDLTRFTYRQVEHPTTLLSEADIRELTLFWVPTGAETWLTWSPTIEIDTLPEWYAGIFAKLDTFLALESNWDSYGAPPLDLGALAQARLILSLISQFKMPKPSVLATSKGGVQFEWHTLRYDMEIEIAPSNELSLFFEEVGQKEPFEKEHATDLDARELLKKVGSVHS